MNPIAHLIEACIAASRPAGHLWTAAAVSIAFAALARAIKGVTPSGALAGAPVCFLIYAGAGSGGFAALVAVFALAWLSTRCGYSRKQRLGMAERRDGRRGSQVLANLTVAAVCALLHAVSGHAIYLLAMASAFAEAAADTVSSEIGQAGSAQARLITTWEWVPAGTDGAVTALGMLAGLAAAAIVTLVCALTASIPWRWTGIALTSALAGMLADSYLGAWLERRGMLNNDAVNFLSTLLAAACAFLLLQ